MKPFNLLNIFLAMLLLALSVPLAPAAQGALPVPGGGIPAGVPPDRPAPEPAPQRIDFGRLPLYFVTNEGQVDGRVAYYVEGRDKVIYFARHGLTFALTAPAPPAATAPSEDPFSRRLGRGESPRERSAVKLDFVGANAVQPIGQAETGAFVSYFRGPRQAWHAGVPTYARIEYLGLWPGIDLAYSGAVGRLKYEFVVAPGADPARIRLAYRGATVHLDETGQLEVSTPAGGFTDDTPVAYQEVDGRRVPVAAAYLLEDPAAADGRQVYGFRLGAYDPALPLVIDPAVLIYAGYIGGAGDDYGTSIAVDDDGNAYITGYTASDATSFPLLSGPYQTFGGIKDAFVVKVNTAGTGLVYAGYIGGSGTDIADSIAVDTAGNAYIAGYTASTEASFPVTVGPDLSWNGGYLHGADAFVAKVNPTGSDLVCAGYPGSGGDDYGYGIAVSPSGPM